MSERCPRVVSVTPGGIVMTLTQPAPASDWCSCDEGLVRDCPIHGEWPNPTLDQTTTKGDTDG